MSLTLALPMGRGRRCLLQPLRLGKGATWGLLKDLTHTQKLERHSGLVPSPHQRNKKWESGLYQSTGAAITNYHRWCDLNKQDVFLTILEAGSPTLRSSRVWFPVRAHFLACRQQLCSHTVLPLDVLWCEVGREAGREGERKERKGGGERICFCYLVL